MLWGVVVVIGDNEGGRKESHKLEKLPVSEYEQVTCWFRVGLLDLKSNGNLTKRTVTCLPNGYFVGVLECNFACHIMAHLISSLQSCRRMIMSFEPSDV